MKKFQRQQIETFHMDKLKGWKAEKFLFSKKQLPKGKLRVDLIPNTELRQFIIDDKDNWHNYSEKKKENW